MNIRFRLIAAAALLLFASFAAKAAESFNVSAELLHNGKSFGSPSAVVAGDTRATIEVTGPKGYKFSFTVTDSAPGKIKVAATVDSSHGSFAPVVVVRPGEPATVSVGDLGLKITVQRSGG